MANDLSKQKYYENISNTIIKNLKKHQMEGYYCKDTNSAIEKALELIKKGSTVGFGGSVTLDELGVLKALENNDYNLINRNLATNLEEEKNIYNKIFSADYFLMSSNAITINGELINIDGKGNRVSFLCFGPENVLIFVGINKIVTDIEAGIKRTRDIAAPPNAVRLNRNTPCKISGKCENCYSSECMCSQFVVTRRSGTLDRIKVIIIGEELGY